jgi:predicted dehydrogenase
MLRWGILGTARINRRVIPAIRLAKRSQLVAIASRDRGRADSYAREWSIPRAIGGYQALLDDSSIDAVYIPLPNTDHVPWTLAAIAAGKHVLCEKPLALTAADVDRIAAAATAAKLVVEEGFMYRHEPLTARVVSMIRDGAVGNVRAIVSGFTFALETENNIRLDANLGGGSLWDVGSYPITYAQLIMGHEPKMVFGTAHWHPSGVDEEFTGLLRFDEGATANIYAGFRVAYRTWLEILGSEGRSQFRIPSVPVRSRRWSSNATARSNTSQSPALQKSSCARSRISKRACSTARPPSSLLQRVIRPRRHSADCTHLRARRARDSAPSARRAEQLK